MSKCACSIRSPRAAADCAWRARVLRDFGRINRRMHNKSWIADNRIALVGGRNLGDEYFGASDEVNFVDLDFAMVGPGGARRVGVLRPLLEFLVGLADGTAGSRDVRSASRARAPARQARRTRPPARRDSRYAQALRDNDGVAAAGAGRLAAAMVGEVSLRIRRSGQGHDAGARRVARRRGCRAAADDARCRARHCEIISPYFVPGEQGSAGLIARAKAGATVQVLTNSLAANDVASVHGGYSRHREALLEGGVQLFELKPLSGKAAESSLTGSSGASLHTKALTADGNDAVRRQLQPRSALDLAQLRAGRAGRGRDAGRRSSARFSTCRSRAAAPGTCRSADGNLRWGDGQETAGQRTAAPPFCRNSRPGWRACSISTRSCSCTMLARQRGEHAHVESHGWLNVLHGGAAAVAQGGRRSSRGAAGNRCSTDATCPAGRSRSRSIRWARTTPEPFVSRTA